MTSDAASQNGKTDLKLMATAMEDVSWSAKTSGAGFTAQILRTHANYQFCFFAKSEKWPCEFETSANPDEGFSTRVQRTLKVIGRSSWVTDVQLNRSVIMEKFVLATRRFIRDEEGVTAIEYGLIASLIAVVIIVAAGNVGDGLKDTFNNIADCLGADSGGTCPSGT